MVTVIALIVQIVNICGDTQKCKSHDQELPVTFHIDLLITQQWKGIKFLGGV